MMPTTTPPPQIDDLCYRIIDSAQAGDLDTAHQQANELSQAFNRLAQLYRTTVHRIYDAAYDNDDVLLLTITGTEKDLTTAFLAFHDNPLLRPHPDDSTSLAEWIHQCLNAAIPLNDITLSNDHTGRTTVQLHCPTSQVVWWATTLQDQLTPGSITLTLPHPSDDV